MVDLAAMRDAVAKHGVDPGLVNPKCPTDLIVDHSLQIDYNKWCGLPSSLMFFIIFYNLIKREGKNNKTVLLLLHVYCASIVPYRILPTLVEGTVRTRAKLPPAPSLPGLLPEEVHIVEASEAPAAKLPAATHPPPWVEVQLLSSRSRILPSSVPSTCSPFLSKFYGT